MTLIENLSIQEKAAIAELKMRMKIDLTPTMQEDTSLFYRFLKARDFDVDKAETMLRKHISWRKVHNMDNILQDFKPSEAFLKYVPGTHIGEDKEGCLVRYIPAGNIDARDIVKCFKLNNYVKHWIYIAEKDIADLKDINLKTGGNSWKIAPIVNLENLKLASVIHPSSTACLPKFLEACQDHFPERLKSVSIINAPSFFVILYSILRRVLAPQVARKFKVYGRNGWQEELLKTIDADISPAFLGGNRTDPDGNPACNTFISHGGRLPRKYFLPKEDRSFKDKSLVKQITLPPRRHCEIFVEIKRGGSVIQWEYMVNIKDIGFGLYLKTSDDEIKEILPIWRFDTPDGTEIGSFKCENTGTYVVIFDNSFSWMNTKEVSYSITVKNPEE